MFLTDNLQRVGYTAGQDTGGAIGAQPAMILSSEGDSKINISTPLTTVQVINCMSDRRTPSRFLMIFSMAIICAAKQKAQMRVYKSPLLIEKPSLMQMKYMPTAATTTLMPCSRETERL